MMTDLEQWEQDYNLMVHYREALEEILDEYENPLGCKVDGAKMGKIAKEALTEFLPNKENMTKQQKLDWLERIKNKQF